MTSYPTCKLCLSCAIVHFCCFICNHKGSESSTLKNTKLLKRNKGHSRLKGIPCRALESQLWQILFRQLVYFRRYYTYTDYTVKICYNGYSQLKMRTLTGRWISQFWKMITDFFSPTIRSPLYDQVYLVDCLSQVEGECNVLILHQASFPTDE